MATYHNPIQRAGDFADPFVLRHDGRYYLYCTNPDVRSWSSSDLVEWRLEGPTIDDDAFPGLVPFAPEVVYADGAFYMYTSPSGHGHFVLRSESPTGPFRLVSGNVGRAIDGNVFIDDDGRWYFYWAGDEGIWGCEMPSPTEFGAPVFTGIHMNGWTEGPFVSKRDGVYSMTLTGNHYLSPGYRIDAAHSSDPLRGYRADPLNPILVGADGPNVGLGHSSSVIGPDLVSTYLVYHNLNRDESRDLDIDRQVWCGRSLQVLGPTTSAPAPARPDAWIDWSGGVAGWSASSGDLEVRDGAGFLSGTDARAAWSAVTQDASFTAELNLTASASDLEYGVTLGDVLVLRVDPAAGTVIAIGSGGGEPLASGILSPGFVHSALHCWRLIHDGGELRVFLDGRLQLSIPGDVPVGSVFGVFADTGPFRIGYAALTHNASARADREAAKPVPGRFWAALGVDGEHGPELVPAGEAAYDAIRLRPGTAVRYRLHVQQAGPSAVHLAGEFTPGDALIVEVDGRRHELRVDRQSGLVSVPVDLVANTSRLTIEGAEGEPLVALVTVSPRAKPGAATLDDERAAGVGKRLLAAGRWDDATVTAKVRFALESPDAHADLLLRASQLSEGGEGDDSRLGINFLLGYSIQLHHDRVLLARHDYDERVLVERPLSIDGSLPHVLRVRAAGSSIGLSIDGVEVFQVDDVLAHPVGGIGVRTKDAILHVESLQVQPERAG